MIEIERFLNDFGVEYWTKGKNVAEGFINVNCKFCDDGSNHGGFSEDGNIYLCWRCGRHDVVDALSLVTGITKKELFPILNQYKTYTTSIQQPYERDTKTIQNSYNNMGSVSMIGGKLEKQHKDYLYKRNFDAEFLERKYQLKGTLFTGDVFGYRIVIPIIYENKIVSYQARDFTDKQKLRYVTCRKENEIISMKNLLYNLDNSRLDSVLVVEGMFDVFRFGDNTVAVMGVGYTKTQLSILAKRYRNIYIMFDNEKDAQQRAKQLENQLGVIGKNVVNVLLDSGDPADQKNDVVTQIKKDLKIY